MGDDGDAGLLARVADGDRQSLARLYDRYAAGLLAIGQRLLKDVREAEDLLHDVFLEVWRQAADYDPARGSVRGWLLLRMRSRALDRLKSAGARRVVSIEERPLDEEPRAAGHDPTGALDGERLRRALAELPPQQREVLELGYFEGLSSSEIAARIAAPIGTVKSRVAAALSTLRAGIDKRGGEA